MKGKHLAAGAPRRGSGAARVIGRGLLVLFTVLFAVLLSCCFHYFPVFSVLSGGWGIIVITLVVSAVAAVLFPIEVEEVHE